ncbi:hypothetical protein [Chrysiogenes arsenatis]|uniref:hypothetical protein n=1 Tax=Chrysiogenes arsenatis TaxID=309797 RepID=UPI0004187E21|nr:hypothetical protein [Chrysiogenes arsenatis]
MASSSVIINTGAPRVNPTITFDQTKSVIDARTAQITNVANQASTTMTAQMNAIANMANTFTPNTGNNTTPPSSLLAGVQIPSFKPGSTPQGSILKPAQPTRATKPNLTNISAITPPTLPSYSVVAPSLAPIAKPAKVNIPSPGDMPSMVTLVKPTAPEIKDIAMPSITLPSIPAAPSVSVSAFAEFAGIFTGSAPVAFASSAPEAYTTAGYWGALLGKILDDITNGGTGLNAEVEAAIFNRHLDRIEEVLEKQTDDTMNFFASRGFSMPTGAMAATLANLQKQAAKEKITASNEIAIAQAELAQKNTQFSMDIGVKVEGILRDFYNERVRQMFEAARYTAENSIAIYDAAVKKYNLDIEVYRTKALAYETSIKGELAKIDIYRGQMEGAKLGADFERLKIEVYQGQIAAAESRVRLYSAQMSAVEVEAKLEMAKLEEYRLKTQAYLAAIDAQKAEFSMFETEVRAQGTEVEIYKAKLQAKAIELESAIKAHQSKIETVKAQLEYNSQLVEQYRADASIYDTEVKANIADVSSQVAMYEAKISAYRADVGAQEAAAKVQTEILKASIAEAEANIRLGIAGTEATARQFESVSALRLKAQEGIMNVNAQLVASAMNAINTSVSLGFSGGTNSSYSSSDSDSRSRSTSESHIYNHE